MVFNYDSVIVVYESLFFCVLYVYSVKYPDIKLNILGTYRVNMSWFLWIYLFIGGSRDSMVENLIGVAVGNIYLFLKEVFPLATGFHILSTPHAVFGH